MRRVPLFAAACAAAAAVLLLPSGANAAPGSTPVKVNAAVAADCDPADATNPAVINPKIDPVEIAVGVQDVHSFVYTVGLWDPCGVTEAHMHGTRTTGLDRKDFPLFHVDTQADGTQIWAGQVDLDPVTDLANVDAGTWTSTVHATDGKDNTGITTGPNFYLQRWAHMTNNASPEPVTKGATITIAGKLSRANWDDYRYHGYANHPVTLQFRTLTGSYSDVKTINTSSTGTLRTTVKAAQDGCFRFNFKGTTTTQPVKGVGDCVDVR